MKRLLATAILLWSVTGHASVPITAYEAELRPDLVKGSLIGRTTVVFRNAGKSAMPELAVHDLAVDSVHLDGRALAFRISEGLLRFDPGLAVTVDREHRLAVAYHGRPSHGLIFGDGFVYTSFSTCEWMLCVDDLAKAPVRMEIVVPADLKVVASGDKISSIKQADGLVHHIWQENRPYSPYLYGFAAGRMHETNVWAGATRLRYLSLSDDRAALRRKLRDLPRAIRFFAAKAGVPLPHTTYTQVVVPNDEAQEMSSFSVIGNEVLDPILKDPKEDWSFVHELAHQWWGNLVTCREWKDFWLNEGITVFMTAAYQQHRWGDAAYKNELALARKRYQKAIDAGWDRPLTFAGDYPSLGLKRALVYSKGALFVDALRHEVGEKPFWRGLRNYTRTQVGRAVLTRDFQNAMEAAAGRKLDSIFAHWVY